MKFVKYLFLLILLPLFLLLVSILVLFLLSQKWESEFISNMNPEYSFTVENISEDGIEQKVVEYIVSGADNDFIEFNINEIGSLIFSNVQNSLGEDIELTELYLLPSRNKWEVCNRFQLSEFNFIYAWVCLDFVKDNRETAQLHVDRLEVQGFDISSLVPGIIGNINSGLSNALITVNENGFVGRIYENIELFEDKIVVRGSLY